MNQPDALRWFTDPGRRRATLAAAAALLTGLFLRVFFIRTFPRIAGDPMIYMDYTRTLLEHHIYGYTRMVAGVSHSYPSLVRLPGYPLFLAACFILFGHTSVTAVLYVQAVVDLCTCALVACTATRLFGARAGWFTLWLAVLCPFTATYVAAPLTETLVLFTIALAFYALTRWEQIRWEQMGAQRWLYCLAAALAYSILLRPDQALLAVAIVPAVFWLSPGRKLLPALLVAVLTLLPLVPWTIRNAHTMHAFQPLAPRDANDPGEPVSTGFNRWYRTWGVEYATNETVYWAYNNDPILTKDLPARAFDSPAQREATQALLDEYSLTTTETPALDARFAALAAERIHGHLLRFYVELPALRVLDMLFRPRTELLPVHDDWWKPHAREWPETLAAAGLYAALNFVYFFLAAAGFLRRKALLLNKKASAPILWSMAASILLRTLLLATLDNAEPRYTLEFFPVLFILGGAWLAGRRSATSSPSHRTA